MSNKNPTFTQLAPEVQAEIKQKFMEGYSTIQLANDYNLVRQSLDWLVGNRNWREQRRLMRAELFQNFSDTKRSAFTGIYLDGTTLLRNAIRDSLKEYEQGNLTIKEKLEMAKKISEVIKELDKIQRLDEGKPTDIIEEKPFAVEDLQRRMRNDPFYQEEIESADFKEIDSSSTDSN